MALRSDTIFYGLHFVYYKEIERKRKRKKVREKQSVKKARGKENEFKSIKNRNQKGNIDT